VKKTDNLRIARACGATIVSRPDELQECDVGTGCGVFDIRKIGEDYFTFFEECKDPKACTILLRGGSRDVLMELERNLQDAMQVARNVVFEPKLLPGGGAVEMAISVALAEKARTLEGVELWPFKAVGSALEVIPRTLAQNAGADVVRLLTELRARKAGGAEPYLGIDGVKGTLVDMRGPGGVLDPYAVRTQTIKSAIESACMLLRIGACGAVSFVGGVGAPLLLFLALLGSPPPASHLFPPLRPPPRADDNLTGHRNQKYDAQREDKRPAEEQDEERGGAAIGED
jgi:T-complex protein 1 subunit gamma